LFVKDRFTGVHLCSYKVKATEGDLSLHQKLYFYLIPYNVVPLK